MDGSIRLYRQILNSQVFAHQTALKIWVWCLCKASYKERFISLKIGKGETTVKVLPGQFIFGRFAAEEELGIDGSTIYKWMKKFESPEYDMISIESSSQYSIISINNWGDYQIEDKPKRTTKEQPKNNQVAAEEQPCNTNNKVNKVYNDYYDGEIISSQNDENYIAVVKVLFGNNNLCRPLHAVLAMPEQLSYEQFRRLFVYKQKYGVVFSDIFEQMENWSDLKKRKTVSQTFMTFMKRRHPEITEK